MILPQILTLHSPSRGIIYATGALTSGMTAASSYYINHTTPNAQPLVFSERTRGHVRRIHAVSGTAVKVTAKTTGLINDAIGRAVEYVSGSASASAQAPGRAAVATSGTTSALGSAPLLPPRKSDTSEKQSGSGRVPTPTPPEQPPRLPLKNRILFSADLLLTTVENSAKHIVEHSTQKISESLGHKYVVCRTLSFALNFGP